MINEKINIKHVIFKLISRWHYFVITACIIIPLGYLYTKYAVKQYEVQGSLLAKKEHTNDLSDKEFMKGMELFASSTALEDEIGVLKSYSLIQQAVSELDFGISYYSKLPLQATERYGNFPFKIILDSTFNQVCEVPVFIEHLADGDFRITAKGKHVDAYNFLTKQKESYYEAIDIDARAEADKQYGSPYLSFKIVFDSTYKPVGNESYFFVIHDLNAVVESCQKSLSVSPISRESNIVSLSIRGPVPDKAVIFLHKLFEVYLKNELNKKNQLGIHTIQFIDNQLSGVSDSLKQVEGSLETFRLKSSIQDINATAENLSKNLDRLESERAAIEVKLKYYTYISNSISEGHIGDIVAPSTFGLEDPLLSNLLIELSKLNQERAGLNYNAKEQNPLAEVVDLKIKNTKKTLQENVNNIINVSAIAIRDFDERIYKIKKELNRLPHNERELVNIQRRFDFSDNVYNYLLEKRAEAGIAIASNAIEKTVIDPPRMVGSGPVSPNARMIYVLAFVLSVIVAVAIIVIKDFWNDHIVTNEDVESATSIPFIGSILHGSRLEKGASVSTKRSVFYESFQSLRVNLQYLTLGKSRNVIGFTSSVESEGKTFCAVNLASAVAMSGKKTILIDADMRRPSVSRYLKLENNKGLSNFLVGGCTIEEIIKPTHIKGFNIITSGPIPPNPVNLIGLSQFEELINTLRQTYDTIIIDAPPVGYVAEYIILMKYTDANIYVVRSGYTSRYHLDKINKLFEAKKIKNVSILLNDVKMSRLNGYNYSYGTAY